MANSRKFHSDLSGHVTATLLPLVAPGKKILLGLSGGMDSVVLLHILHELAPRFSWHISALHVHHGISRNADAWAGFCASLCASYGIALQIEQVDISALRGKHGIEAAARQLRHAAFARQVCDFIALAHHADDQAETLLLQLLRGSGIKGVAAMPVLKPTSTDKAAVLRPLLDISRGHLLDYARQHALDWIEDESNADDYYPRNFLRHQVLPKLEQKFPAYRDALLRSSQHFAEAAELLDELACQDMNSFQKTERQLPLVALTGLPFARAKNLLRYFLHSCDAVMPHAAQLDNVLQQLRQAQDDAHVCLEFGDWQLRLYQHRVHVLPVPPRIEHAQTLCWQGEVELAWPASGCRLLFSRTSGQGIALKKLQAAPVSIRLRSGGERLRPHPRAATRSLKNLLQQHHIPPWQRERLPLLFCGDELVCVVGVAIAAEYQALAGEDGVVISIR